MDEYLTLTEACAMLKLSKARVRELMRRGHLVDGVHYSRPAGMRVRFVRTALAQYLCSPTTRRRTRSWGEQKVNLEGVA